MGAIRLAKLQTFLGWAAAGLFLGATLALADGLVAGVDPRTVNVVAGSTVPLSGPLPPDAHALGEMAITTDTPAVTLTATDQFTGYWLGDRKWRGALRVAPRTPAGAATLTLTGPSGPAAVPQTVQVRIFADQAAMNAASPSRVRRLAGWPPYGLAAVFFGLALAAGGGVYLLARRLEAGWLAEGKAAVYRNTTTPEGQQIAFGLGADQGLAPGASVTVRTADGRTLAVASVVACTPTDATALVTGEKTVKPGSYVFFTRPDTPDGTRR